jgi:hypothetical protein
VIRDSERAERLERARDAGCFEVPFSAGGGQVRLLTAREDARPTDVGTRGERVEAVEVGRILRMILDLGFLIWLMIRA